MMFEQTCLEGAMFQDTMSPKLWQCPQRPHWQDPTGKSGCGASKHGRY